MATSDDRAASGLLLAAVISAMMLALLVPLAGSGAARMPSGHPRDLAARSLTPPDGASSGMDGHGVTASILAGRSSNVADFVRTWDDRTRNVEEAQLGTDLPNPDGDFVYDGNDVQRGTNPLDQIDNQTPEPPFYRGGTPRALSDLCLSPTPPRHQSPASPSSDPWSVVSPREASFRVSDADGPGWHGQNRQCHEEWANRLARLARRTA